jgi:hypothetical protein
LLVTGKKERATHSRRFLFSTPYWGAAYSSFTDCTNPRSLNFAMNRRSDETADAQLIIDNIRSLKLLAEQEALIFSGNARKLFNL